MNRVFTAQHQDAFALLAGDYNPMHVDPIAARRLMFGRPVVHGIHAVLWALDQYLAQRGSADANRTRIIKIAVEFRSPMLVGDAIDLTILPQDNNTTRLELTSNSSSTATIEVALDLLDSTAPSVEIETSNPPRQTCRDISPADVKQATGELALHCNPELASTLFPTLVDRILPAQLAALLATTRLVGMELPGLHSIYTGFDLVRSDETKLPNLSYAVDSSSQRLAMLLNISVNAPGFAGKLSAAFRPPPTNQASIGELQKLVKADEFAGQRVLVIGGSRGLGEVAVKQLLAGGADVRFTYRKGAADAQKIVTDAAESGYSVSCFGFDVQSDSASLTQLLGEWRPTHLCYFATPHISSPLPDHFLAPRFHDFCSVYVDAFLNTFSALASGLSGVLYPSSSAIDELPSNMGEYAAAKVAAENMCQFLAKVNPSVIFHTPRYSRLATDQTATVMAVQTGDTLGTVLHSLRKLRTPGQVATTLASETKSKKDTIATAPAFAVAATFTAEPIEPFLQFWLQQFGQSGSVQFAPYNQIFQTMLDPAGLFSKKNFANVALIRLEDWIEGNKTELDSQAWRAKLTPLAAELISSAAAISRPALTLIVICPPSSKVTALAGVAAVLDELTRDLVTQLHATPGIYAFGPQSVFDLYPVADFYSPSADAVAKIPYTPAYFAGLGTFVARSALSVRRSPFKAIVLDCDNTLWSGVCGEGGVNAVKISPGHRALQQFVIEQTVQGKIICLCSKNVESDVWDIFENHPDMLLKRSQIVAHRINWASKSQNLRELSKELNLGLDSFIFLDDNPVECAEVRSNCPAVLTLTAPANGDDWPNYLKHIWAFDQLKVTDQDQKRAASYLQNAQREEVRKQSGGLDDFLSRLNLQVDIARVTSEKLPRVAQLSERTNQFNFTTIRRTESEIVALLKDPAFSCETVEVKDRFGEYGLVGITISQATEDALRLDTMLLSCRVLGRGVEYQMLANLGKRARSLGLSRVDISFVHTEKNQPALDFLKNAAGHFATETPTGFNYRIPVEVAETIKAKVISAPPEEDIKESKSSHAGSAVAAIPYQTIAKEFNNAESILAAVKPAPVAASGSTPLKNIVAELLGIAPEQLSAERLLSGARLPGSLGRAILDAALRDRLGIECAAVYSVKTYGELEQAVGAVATGSVGSNAVAAPAQVIKPSITVSQKAGDEQDSPVRNALAAQLATVAPSVACGTDIELIESLPVTTQYESHEFYVAHFTTAEIEYCKRQQFAREHFAARWSAKEALKKCEPSLLTESMNRIEIILNENGAPSFQHHGKNGIAALPHALTLSHTSLAAMAVVVRSVPANGQMEKANSHQVSAASSKPVGKTSLIQSAKKMSWVDRLKQAVVRRIAAALARDAGEKRRADWESQATLDPTAVILPEALIENVSGKKDRIVIGDHSYIRGRLLVYPNAGSITIGSWSYVGSRSEIWAMADMVIGDRVMIANNVTVLDCSGHSRNARERHEHFRKIVTTGHPSSWSDLPGMSAEPIVIEDDAWIGAGTSILPGVRIGARAVVAAGSKVSTDIPADTVYWNETDSKSIKNYA